MSSLLKTDNIIVDNIDLNTINNSTYPPANPLVPLPLVASKVLVTNPAGTAVLWGEVPHGTARQLLQTNAAGTSSEWTSDIEVVDTNITGDLQFNAVSGSVGQVLKKTGAATQAFADIAGADIKGGTLNQVLQSDGTNGVFNSNVTVPGTLTSTGTLTASNATNLVGNLQFNAVSGTTGQFVKKTGATTQAFADIVAADTKGGTLNQVMQSDGTNGVFNSNVTIPGTLTARNTTNLVGNLQFNAVSGTTGQVVKKTGVATQAFADLAGADIKGGTLNQVLQSDGTNGVFNTNVTIPGTLTSTGTLTASNTTNLVGNLQFNAASGTTGQVIKKTGATTQAFADLAGTDIKGGTLNQVLQSDGTNGVFNTNVTIPGTLTSTGTLTASNATNLVGNLQFNAVSGTTGQFVKKTGAATQAFTNITAADTKGGVLNQVLQSDGTNGVFNSNVFIPGTLISSGAFTANTTATITSTFTASGLSNLVGNLQFNAASGSTGQYVRKTSATTQTWANIPVADITPGTNGQIVITSGGVAIWSNSSVLTSFMRFFNNTPYNINTGTNTFAVKGVQQVNTGSPFTFNVAVGTFTCIIAGTYVWNFNTILSTHDAQSKFLITNGTTIQCAQQIDYVAGLTTAQPFSYSGTFAATIGQNWAVGFASFGVGGVCNTSAADVTFLCPTTTLEITRL